jgi:hypothetical protein
MIRTKATVALLVTALICGGLALWWRYGLAIVLAEPIWFCFSR